MIGLVERPGTFSDRWIAYLKTNSIDFCVIDPYKNDAIKDILKCEIFLWHYLHHDPKEMLVAPMVMDACDSLGVRTFPDHRARAHYDNKMKQYIIMKAHNYPTVNSYIFFSMQAALANVMSLRLPIVFKLKGGAGSRNVFLVNSRLHMFWLIIKSFCFGHSQFNSFSNFTRTIKGCALGSESLKSMGKSFVRLFIKPKIAREMPKERGYLYLQEFVPNNDGDIRIIIIGSRAIGIKRMNRPKDFRASGSGIISYDSTLIPKEALKVAFAVSGAQGYDCMTYDFVFKDGRPLIVEMSFGFAPRSYDPCPGYWNKNLEFIECEVMLEDWMLDWVINERS